MTWKKLTFTRNIYESSPENCNELLSENITKSYKIGKEELASDINSELKNIADNLSIGERNDIMAKKSAFITIKDHKDNFNSNPKCRLSNPSKSELGKVSKIILDNMH